MPNVNIDIGLEVLCVVSEHGETLSRDDIADVCECSGNYIHEVEKRALKKLQQKLDSFSASDFIDC